MTVYVRIFAGIMFGILLPSVFFAQRSEPRFENYSVKVWPGRATSLNLSSHRLARMYRTGIREQMQEEGINFAGHYTVAAMGCHSAMHRGARLCLHLKLKLQNANSRLIRAIGRPRLGADERWGPSGVYYYEWLNNQLRQSPLRAGWFVSTIRSLSLNGRHFDPCITQVLITQKYLSATL